MKKNQTVFYILFFIISISIFGIVNYLDKINLYEIKTFEINGNKFIGKNEIKDIVQKSVENLSYNLDINKIQESLNNHSYINNSKVYSKLPSKIIIEINEITPLAIYENNNDIFFLDKNLDKIQANHNSINYYSVPVITNIKNQNNYKDIGNILTILKKENQKFYSSINELIIKEDIILIKIQNGTKIYIKRNKEINNTIKLLSFLNTIKNNKEITDYKYVDLTIPKQIIVKENKKI